MLQEASKRPPDALKTAKITFKTPPRPPNTSTRGFQMILRRSSSTPRPPKPPQEASHAAKTPNIASKILQMLVSCPKILLHCEVHAKSLPISKVRQGCLSPQAKHDGLLSKSWPFTKGGLAVVRPRRASSIRQNTLVLQWRVQNRGRDTRARPSSSSSASKKP